jgi:hypothetical protein
VCALGDDSDDDADPSYGTAPESSSSHDGTSHDSSEPDDDDEDDESLPTEVPEPEPDVVAPPGAVTAIVAARAPITAVLTPATTTRLVRNLRERSAARRRRARAPGSGAWGCAWSSMPRL